MTFQGFEPSIFQFLEQLADNNNRRGSKRTNGGTRGKCWSPVWRSSARLPQAEEALAAFRGQRPTRRRVVDAHLPGHAVRQGQDAVQDECRHPVPARIRQGRPRAGILRPHRAGRVLSGDGRLAAGSGITSVGPSSDRRSSRPLEASQQRPQFRARFQLDGDSLKTRRAASPPTIR
jgi:hypothetical protein